jgi:hypothetical protein
MIHHRCAQTSPWLASNSTLSLSQAAIHGYRLVQA